MLILGETWRSSRSNSKRRDSVDDQLEELSKKLLELTTRVDAFAGNYEDRWQEEKLRFVAFISDLCDSKMKIRNDELARILERVVEIGLRGGWTEFESTPLQLPRIQLAPRPYSPPPKEPSSPDQDSSEINFGPSSPDSNT